MEEFLAAALARAACFLAGALMVRLIRALLAMPSPARPQGPRRTGWPGAGHACGGSAKAGRQGRGRSIRR
jgi:hypothetical protein